MAVRKRGSEMIEDKKFDLHIRMKSGRKYLFELSKTELDWLNEFINIFEIEYLKYEKVVVDEIN